MKSRNNDEIELEEALAREIENLEKLLLECYEQDKSHLQAKALEQMHQENLRLWKEIEYVRAIERERLERVKCEHQLIYKRDMYGMREERDNALKLVHEITTKHENMCLKAERFESKYEGELILTKTLNKEKQEITTKHENMCLKAKEFETKYKDELILTKALIEEKQEITTKHEKMCLKAERFERKYEGELILTKALMKEKQEITTKHENMCLKAKEFKSKYKSELNLTKALIKANQEITTKHENMCFKAEKFESKYKSELNLTKALIKAKQKLEISRKTTKDADAMRQERDNAIKFINEITTRKQVASFICPISQEVMEDPQLTSDGFTYEAESIRRWFSTGRHTSPMTNLKLSHTNLVPNRALRSAIQELV